MNKPQPIFIFSMVRSGSTLLQRILGANPEIAIVGETHLLVPLLYAFKRGAVYAEYSHEVITQASADLVKILPRGKQDYDEALRHFVMDVYGRAAGRPVRYIVDKTPRYALVASEILDLFPEGKFIFLWRNPLAIVASIMSSFHQGVWNMHHNAILLERGQQNLVHAYSTHKNSGFGLRYEDLVAQPQATLRPLFEYLELPFDKEVLTQFQYVRVPGGLRDPNMDLPTNQQLHTDSLDKWQETLGNLLRKRWCNKYLKSLGRDALAVMGYDLDTLLAELNVAPTTSRYLASDMWRMPLGWSYDFLELRIFKDKWNAWLKGERVYLHV